MNPISGIPTTSRSKKALALWLAVAVVVIAVVIWYYYAYYAAPLLPRGPDAATTRLETQGTSDEVSAIEQDLNATDLGDLDKELSDIEAELAPQ